MKLIKTSLITWFFPTPGFMPCFLCHTGEAVIHATYEEPYAKITLPVCNECVAMPATDVERKLFKREGK